MRNKDVALLVLVVLVTGLASWINFAPTDSEGRQRWPFAPTGRDVTTRLGLDLQGGTQVLLQAEGSNLTSDVMNTAATVIERRVNGLGVSESIVQQSGNDRIIVELPGVTNPEQAVETLRGTGQLEFIDTAGQSLPTGTFVKTSNNPNPVVPQATDTLSSTGGLSDTQPLTSTVEGPVYQSITKGADLDTNAVQPIYGGRQSLSGQYAVSFAFNGDSANSLADFTSRNIQRPMCIVLNNQVFSCPVIQAALIGGQGEITTATRADAESIYNQLKFGALPVPLRVESSRTVSATLGQDSVNASLLAGIVGLVVVGLFMILFYRLPGVLATIALLIYTAITFALYKIIPVTLTLAGIAGFILSIGVAVDANVLIFARLREELRRGKNLRAAVEAGFQEAWPAIRDSSASTLITSAILFMFGNSFGVSIIKGFALTLGLGIIISLFTAITVTRLLLRLVAPMGFAQNPWMFDLERAPFLERNRGNQSGEITA